MSHFSVIVCLDDKDGRLARASRIAERGFPDGKAIPAFGGNEGFLARRVNQRLEAIMAPWDENRATEPYRRYEEDGPAGFWLYESLRRAAEHVAAGTGILPYKPDQFGWSSASSKDAPEAQRRALEAEAQLFRSLPDPPSWTDLARLAGTPEAMPWSAFTDNISEGNGYTIERARVEYHSQPRVLALRADDEFRWMGDPITAFGVPEKLYVEREGSASAVPGYAIVTLDGRWMAPGRMGWFAMSTESEGERIGYLEAANAYIDSLEDSAWLVALDCHI